MAIDLTDRIVGRLPFLSGLGEAAHQWLSRLGATTAPQSGLLKDALNGTWLGHALHPALTDVPIGLWGGATVLDLADAAGGEGAARGADTLLALGCLAALGAAATGVADWQDKYGRERDVGTAHALINSAALALNVGSLSVRLSGGSRRLARALSLSGIATTGLGAYLGGDMVFRLGVQVNRNAFQSGPKKWTSVADEAEVGADEFLRKQVGKNQVLLCRHQGRIVAVGAVCSHAGGPLDELPLEDGQLHCPWHGSRFDLVSGAVTHGPASVPNPVFEARVSEGKVEIRRR